MNLSNAACFKIYFQMMFQMHVFLNTINRIDIFPYLNIFFGEFFFDMEIFHHFQSKLRSQKNKRKKKNNISAVMRFVLQILERSSRTR